mmetsp:Transcript_14174/g.47851  ORF Transcript_14174/g.47851 Transcript_14174/m.47851 type:complete len:257 (+) Transcript_14174:140-910(+)
MMILSTDRTVHAASVASLSALALEARASTMPSSLALKGSPVTTLMPTSGFASLAAWSVARASVPSLPAFSASVRTTTSRESANLRTAYWSMPLIVAANALSSRASLSSHAPAPTTNAGSLHRALTAFTPSSTARSTSLRRLSVLARSTMVATLESSAASCSKTTTLRPLTSRTSTRVHSPISSGVGAPRRIMPVAPTAPQRRRSSNLLVIFTTIMSLRLRKCRAMSATLPLHTTTRTPAAAMAPTTSSILDSSLLL